MADTGQLAYDITIEYNTGQLFYNLTEHYDQLVTWVITFLKNMILISLPNYHTSIGLHRCLLQVNRAVFVFYLTVRHLCETTLADYSYNTLTI